MLPNGEFASVVFCARAHEVGIQDVRVRSARVQGGETNQGRDETRKDWTLNSTDDNGG